MSTRTDHPGQVVINNENSTEVWEKDSAGKTNYDNYSKYDKETGKTKDYWGRDSKDPNYQDED